VSKLVWWLAKDFKGLISATPDFVSHLPYRGKHVYYTVLFASEVHHHIYIQDEPVPTQYVKLDNQDKPIFVKKPESGVIPIRDMLHDSLLVEILNTFWDDIELLRRST